MPCRLEGEMFNYRRLISEVSSLTVYDHPHILDKTIDDLKCLSCRYPGLVLGEPVQPLKNRVDLILSEKFVHKFLCVALSQAMHQQGWTHLVVLA